MGGRGKTGEAELARKKGRLVRFASAVSLLRIGALRASEPVRRLGAAYTWRRFGQRTLQLQRPPTPANNALVERLQL